MLGLRLKGIRLRVDKGLGRICSVCSALGLEPAFRRCLGLGVGFKVQVKVNQNRSTCYVIGNTACEGLACEPWPPPQHHPTIQWQLQRPTPAPPPPPQWYGLVRGGGGGATGACGEGWGPLELQLEKRPGVTDQASIVRKHYASHKSYNVAQ